MKANKHKQSIEGYLDFLLQETEAEVKSELESESESESVPVKQTTHQTKNFIEKRTPSIERLINTQQATARAANLTNSTTIQIDQQEQQKLDKVRQLLAKMPLQLAEDVKTESTHQSQQAIIESSFVARKFSKAKELLPQEFQTLIFNVGKIPFAVPLLKLGGIINLKQHKITPLPGTPDWFIGLVPGERGNLMMIDTHQFFMPETPMDEVSQEKASQEKTSQEKHKPAYNYLIVLDNSHWALGCHSVTDAKKLLKTDIRWAEKLSRRPWFSGMVVDYMSVLIEVDEVINQLAEHIVK